MKKYRIIEFLIFCVLSVDCFSGTRTETEKFIFTNTVTMEEKAIINESRILNNYSTNLVVHETLSLPVESILLSYLNDNIIDYLTNTYYQIGGKVSTAETADNALLLEGQNSAYYRNADNINTGTLSVDRIPNLSTDKLTSGTLSTDRYSAYADLTAESKLGTGAADRLIRRSDGDGRYYLQGSTVAAATDSANLGGQLPSYYRNANNINAGTLSTDRYSAYADLTAEGWLTGTQNGHLMTRLLGDYRWAQSSHDHNTKYYRKDINETVYDSTRLNNQLSSYYAISTHKHELLEYGIGATFGPDLISGQVSHRASFGPIYWMIFWNSTDGEYQLWSSANQNGGEPLHQVKSFSIKHPIEELKNEKVLVHSSIEGPIVDLIYRGEIQLQNGNANINIDKKFNMTEGTFEALTKNVQYFLQNSDGFDPVIGKVVKNILYIECKNKENNDTINWMVMAERNDPTIKLDPRTDESGSLINEFEQLKDSDNKKDFIIMKSQDGVKYKVKEK